MITSTIIYQAGIPSFFSNGYAHLGEHFLRDEVEAGRVAMRDAPRIAVWVTKQPRFHLLSGTRRTWGLSRLTDLTKETCRAEDLQEGSVKEIRLRHLKSSPLSRPSTGNGDGFGF
jgi:hypothetical protein